MPGSSVHPAIRLTSVAVVKEEEVVRGVAVPCAVDAEPLQGGLHPRPHHWRGSPPHLQGTQHTPVSGMAKMQQLNIFHTLPTTPVTHMHTHVALQRCNIYTQPPDAHLYS